MSFNEQSQKQNEGKLEAKKQVYMNREEDSKTNLIAKGLHEEVIIMSRLKWANRGKKRSEGVCLVVVDCFGSWFCWLKAGAAAFLVYKQRLSRLSADDVADAFCHHWLLGVESTKDKKGWLASWWLWWYHCWWVWRRTMKLTCSGPAASTQRKIECSEWVAS